jgi:hypothetical protein
LTLLKSLVVCLVLANVAYFLWAHGIAKTAGQPAKLSPAQTLRLASESDGALHLPGAAPGGSTAGSGIVGSSGGADVPRAEDGENARNGLSADVKRCISVGPFRDVSEAARAAATLRNGGYDSRQRVADGEVWAGVWVYVPLPALRAAKDQMLAKLKAAGFNDALEMPGPNGGSVLSLGLYSEPRRVQARVAQAHALGFNPGTADRKRTGNVYWIDIDLKPTDSLLNPADLQGEAGHIVRIEVKDCPPAPGASP